MRRIVLTLALCTALAGSLEAACSGRIMNPVSEVCWSCLFPIRVAGMRLSASGASDPDTDAPDVCTCTKGAVPVLGMNMSFFEPIRTVEIVREPYCFPALGGVKTSGPRAASHGRSASRGKPDERSNAAFYQAHWYHTPWLFVLEALLDTTCLEQSAWDLAYLTEVDPLWDDAWASFVLAPESAIFATPAAVAACALDCAAASVGSPRNELFWCVGCQGSLYPLSGWVAAMTNPVSAWELIAARMAVKLAREGLLWAAYGKRGQCGPYLEPIPRKDVFRTQMVRPIATASGNACCHPIGETTFLWGSGKTYPITGEDGAILLWRKRDCCAASGMF